MIVNKYVINAREKCSIVHISDIHYSKNYKMKKLEEIKKNIQALKPTYICITGDLVDNIEVGDQIDLMRPFYAFLSELGDLTKVIISLGNHDIRTYKDLTNNKWYLKLSKIKNVILLDNSNYVDNNICFYGFTASEEYYDKELVNKELLLKELRKIVLNKKNVNVLLIHSPIHLTDDKVYNAIKEFNLALSGHTHNGLMPHFVKGNFGLCGPNHTLFIKNARNSLNNQDIPIIVSGGITKLSWGTGILRFFDKLYESDLNYIELK